MVEEVHHHTNCSEERFCQSYGILILRDYFGWLVVKVKQGIWLIQCQFVRTDKRVRIIKLRFPFGKIRKGSGFSQWQTTHIEFYLIILLPFHH